MMIMYVPQRNDSSLEYVFEGDIVTATYNGTKDIFDFSTLREGDKLVKAESLFDINIIRNAERREDGKLYITLLYFHGANATEEERFPKWMEVELNGEDNN